MPFEIRMKNDGSHKRFEAYLGAAEIPWSQIRSRDEIVFLFEESDAQRAMREWSWFQSEESSPPAVKAPRIRVDGRYSIGASLLMAALLFYFHFVVREQGAFMLWVKAAGASHVQIMAGELFRCVTALTLHLNLKHLLGNLLGLVLFLPLLFRETGAGSGWFLTILAGALGNLANAFFHDSLSPGTTVSIGASTALFATLGLLGARVIRNEWNTPQRWRNALLLPALGLAGLLAIMGVSGQNTDIFAHFFGMLSGVFLGTLSARFDTWRNDVRIQGLGWLLSAVLLIWAWSRVTIAT